MKRMFFIIVLLIFASCSKNDDVLNDDTTLYLDSINNLRSNYLGLDDLKLDEKLIVLSEKCNEYYVNYNKFSDAQTKISMMKVVGINGEYVCFKEIKISDYQTFDLVQTLSTEGQQFIYDPKYTKIGFSIKKTCATICFSYPK